MAVQLSFKVLSSFMQAAYIATALAPDAFRTMSELVEREHLRRYIHDLEKKLGWGAVADWGQRDFQQLSELIEQETGTLVSVTTLKRALGRIEYKGLPYTVTLNALAKVLGYKDWLEFKLADSTKRVAEPVSVPLPNPTTQKKETLPKFWVGFVLGTVLAISVLLAVYFWHGPAKTNAAAQVNTYFGPNRLQIAPTITSDSLPAKFYLSYDIPPEYRGNLNILRIEGKVDKPIRLLTLDSTGHGETVLTVTSPGLYNAKIFSNRSELGKQVFFVPNKTWTARCGKDQQYVPVKTILENGILKLDPVSLAASTLDTSADFLTEFTRIGDFHMTADEMQLECRVKCPSNSINGHRPKIAIRARTENYPVHTTFDASATSLSIFNQYSDVVLSLDDQKKYFQKDLPDWSYLKIVTHNKKASVYLNDRLVYSCTYTKEMGKLYELTVTCRGKPELDVIRLSEYNGRKSYEDDF